LPTVARASIAACAAAARPSGNRRPITARNRPAAPSAGARSEQGTGLVERRTPPAQHGQPRSRTASADVEHVPLASTNLRIRPPLSSSSNAPAGDLPADAVEHEALAGGGRPTESLPNERASHGPSREADGLRERKLSQPQA
jgi:hypothetical protein